MTLLDWRPRTHYRTRGVAFTITTVLENSTHYSVIASLEVSPRRFWQGEGEGGSWGLACRRAVSSIIQRHPKAFSELTKKAANNEPEHASELRKAIVLQQAHLLGFRKEFWGLGARDADAREHERGIDIVLSLKGRPDAYLRIKANGRSAKTHLEHFAEIPVAIIDHTHPQSVAQGLEAFLLQYLVAKAA